MSKYHLPDGASYELRQTRTLSNNVQFAGNKFECIESADQVSQTVRLQHNGKLSVVTSSKPGSDDSLIERAAAMARYGSPYEVPFVGKSDTAQLDLEDEKTLTPKEMIGMMGDFVSDLRGIDPDLTVSAGLEEKRQEVKLRTSNGFDHSYRKSVWSCGSLIELVKGDDLLAIYDIRMSMSPDFDFKQIKDIFTRKLGYAKNVVPFTPGTYPVIFTPREVGHIIRPVTASMNGKAVYMKVSPWSDKLGQKLLDDRFTLTDDASANKSCTSAPFDLEGTPTRRNVLVKDGHAGDLLLDRKYAALLGKESSGNAGQMSPQAVSLRLSPGNKALADMVKSIERGLIIDNTMGAWSGNPYAGIVSGTISMGLVVEKGQVIGRVKDCMFTINAFEHFNKHLVDLSAETNMANNDHFPYVMLDEVVIST